MQVRLDRVPRRTWAWVGGALAAAALAYALRDALLGVLGLVAGAVAICFVAAPVAKLYERRLPRPAAALAALLSMALAALVLGWLLLPRMLSELMDLARTLPRSLNTLSQWAEAARGWAQARLPGVALPELNLRGLEGLLSGVASGTVGFVVNLADVIGRVSMMAVLACFFLSDRDALLLRLELLLPQRHRRMAVRAGNALCREIRMYLRGQLLIAAAVGLLSVAALALVGVRSALVLGPVIGLLNMIPYFGPFIGGVPAVLIALGDGWQKALLTAAALSAVQQLDGSLISPRIMGSLTGFSPALVLVGIYAGARLGGVGGMLLALPTMLAGRTLFRVFVQKCENI